MTIPHGIITLVLNDNTLRTKEPKMSVYSHQSGDNVYS